jgi:RNA polymerase sigma-70 factor, ECF subfamily
MDCSREGMNESELIAKSKEGDTGAIEELLHRHYPSSMRVARNILRQEDDAQDAVQAAYFVAFRRLENFRGESSFKTWITRIVVNCCLLQLRDARNRLNWVQVEDWNGVQGLASQYSSPEQHAWSSEIGSALSTAMARLPKHLREPYTMFTVAELSLQEIAATLGLTMAATKTRLFRARAWMRTSLEPVWAGARAGQIAR